MDRPMNTRQRGAPIGAPVLALHCSGADSRQWDKLAQLLDPTFNLIGIDLYGTRAMGHWPGATPFAIEADAQLALAVLDRLDGAVRLVGHSYGGAVALNVALQRAGRIASVSLYEPSSFHVLKQLGPAGSPALNEITALANVAASGVLAGDYVEAAEVFIDYWNGPGAWLAMKTEVRHALLAWFAKAPLDFQAALSDQTLVTDYRRLTCPVLIMRG
jgi:pimeloyl-ACP methyl ester carboxylesterase